MAGDTNEIATRLMGELLHTRREASWTGCDAWPKMEFTFEKVLSLIITFAPKSHPIITFIAGSPRGVAHMIQPCCVSLVVALGPAVTAVPALFPSNKRPWEASIWDRLSVPVQELGRNLAEARTASEGVRSHQRRCCRGRGRFCLFLATFSFTAVADIVRPCWHSNVSAGGKSGPYRDLAPSGLLMLKVMSCLATEITPRPISLKTMRPASSSPHMKSNASPATLCFVSRYDCARLSERRALATRVVTAVRAARTRKPRVSTWFHENTTGGMIT